MEMLLHRHAVIVVDDDVHVRRLYGDMLQSAGMEAHLSASGEEAARFAAATPGVCVVLADVRMPRMDGFDLQRSMRRTSPDLPVVLITADHLLSIRGGALDKPVAAADLEALVRTNCRAGPTTAQRSST